MKQKGHHTAIFSSENLKHHPSVIQELKRQKQFTEAATAGSGYPGGQRIEAGLIEPQKLGAGTGAREEGALASWRVLLALKGHHETVSANAGQSADWNSLLLPKQPALLRWSRQARKANREMWVLSPRSRPAVSLLAAAKRKLAGREKWLAVSQPSCHKVETGTAGLKHQLWLRAHISPNHRHWILSNFFFFAIRWIKMTCHCSNLHFGMSFLSKKKSLGPNLSYSDLRLKNLHEEMRSEVWERVAWGWAVSLPALMLCVPGNPASSWPRTRLGPVSTPSLTLIVLSSSRGKVFKTEEILASVAIY